MKRLIIILLSLLITITINHPMMIERSMDFENEEDADPIENTSHIIISKSKAPWRIVLEKVKSDLPPLSAFRDSRIEFVRSVSREVIVLSDS